MLKDIGFFGRGLLELCFFPLEFNEIFGHRKLSRNLTKFSAAGNFPENWGVTVRAIVW